MVLSSSGVVTLFEATIVLVMISALESVELRMSGVVMEVKTLSESVEIWTLLRVVLRRSGLVTLFEATIVLVNI